MRTMSETLDRSLKYADDVDEARRVAIVAEREGDLLRAALERIAGLLTDEQLMCSTSGHPEWHCSLCGADEGEEHRASCPVQITRVALKGA
jgi:hypothetical protein